MTPRHKARELALQVLFQWDIHQGTSEWLDAFWAQNPVNPATREFADSIIHGVISEVEELDGVIGRFAHNWSVSRMAFIDRAILRIAVYEFLSFPDIPAPVTLNEAIDLAKDFGDDQSKAFVNGILDRILQEEPRLRLKAQQISPAAKQDGRRGT